MEENGMVEALYVGDNDIVDYGMPLVLIKVQKNADF
jgi:biotin carboxyl carrier protein